MVKRLRPSQLQPYFVAANGIKRINRTRVTENDFVLPQQTKDELPIRKIDTIKNSILCVAFAKNGQLDSHDREIIYIGHILATKYDHCAVVVLVFGEYKNDLGQWGADLIYQSEYDIMLHYQPEMMVNQVGELYEKHKTKHILFPDNDWQGCNLMRRMSVDYQLDMASDVIEIDAYRATRFVNNSTHQASTTLPILLGLQAEISEKKLSFICQPSIKKLALIDPIPTATIIKLDTDQVPLEQSSLILSLGNGVDDVELFIECAQALNASVGGSRMVVDDGKLPRNKQIGTTGKTISANVYIAFGISGAIQHLQGIQNCSTVIAVNTDESCPMILRADISYINDANEVLAQLKMLAENNRKVS